MSTRRRKAAVIRALSWRHRPLTLAQQAALPVIDWARWVRDNPLDATGYVVPDNSLPVTYGIWLDKDVRRFAISNRTATDAELVEASK